MKIGLIKFMSEIKAIFNKYRTSDHRAPPFLIDSSSGFHPLPHYNNMRRPRVIRCLGEAFDADFSRHPGLTRTATASV